MYICIYIYVYIHIHIYIYICMCVCVYIYIIALFETKSHFGLPAAAAVPHLIVPPQLLTYAGVC